MRRGPFSFWHNYHRRDVWLLIVALGAGLLGLFMLWLINLDIPDLSSFSSRRVNQSTKIYDRTGTVLLSDVHEGAQRTVVPIEAMSRNIKNASVAIEDAEFYEHRGVKPSAILRAILVNFTTLSFNQGGSTITQQVVKNSLLTQDKTITRKIKEWVLSLKLERHFSKEKILEVYLNETPYGGNVYGVEEASQAFFGKPSAGLSLAESAYLAALPQAPTYYSPYGARRDKLDERKDLVLLRMRENNFISDSEYEEAKKEQVKFLLQSGSSIKAPHFVFFIREYLEAKYGKEALSTAGYKVTTTLDYELQQKAEEIVKRYALENATKFNAENAGLVAIDPKTGQILAMVGSRDYSDPDIDGNFNVVLGKRQPGSAFKPFVYATAFKKGYRPETTVFDLPTEFSSECTPEGKPIDPDGTAECYHPQNYDEVFLGPVSMRDALAQSRNVPSVKVLYLAGIADSTRTARSMGISTLTDTSRYGLTLVLGGGEVTLLDLTSAYGAFANDGVRLPPTGVLKIEEQNNGSSRTLEEYASHPSTVLDKDIARTVSAVLSDNEARTPAFGERSYLYFPGREVAAKTGTTNDYRDAWIVGYTPNLVVGSWAGNNDNSPMEKKVAGFIVAPMWNAFMEVALKSSPSEPLPKPEPADISSLKPILRGLWQGDTTYLIDRFSGKLATDYTPKEATEERVVKNVHSILYWVDRANPLGPSPSQPAEDAQFNLWEKPVRDWAAARGIADESETIIPKERDDIHTPANQPKVAVSGILNDGSYGSNSRITILASGSGAFPMSRFDFYINNALVGSVRQAPFQFSFVPKDVSGIKERNALTVVGYDNKLNKNEVVVSFKVGIEN